MLGIGTVVNVLAVVIGSGIGLLLKGKLKQRFQHILMQVLGMATIFIGLSGALKGMFVIENNRLTTTGSTLMIISLVLGAFIGELLQIEQRMEHTGEWLKQKMKVENDSRFVEGFVTSSLVICVGAMAVVGAIEDGLAGNPTTLFAKAMLDMMIVMVFSSTLGIGVLFSAVPLGIYQGLITISAKVIEPFLTNELVTNMSFIGGILIFGVGINLLFEKKIRVGNMLPALFIPILIVMVKAILKIS